MLTNFATKYYCNDLLCFNKIYGKCHVSCYEMHQLRPSRTRSAHFAHQRLGSGEKHPPNFAISSFSNWNPRHAIDGRKQPRSIANVGSRNHGGNLLEYRSQRQLVGSN
jgi:hypothetical protein